MNNNCSYTWLSLYLKPGVHFAWIPHSINTSSLSSQQCSPFIGKGTEAPTGWALTSITQLAGGSTEHQSQTQECLFIRSVFKPTSPPVLFHWLFSSDDSIQNSRSQNSRSWAFMPSRTQVFEKCLFFSWGICSEGPKSLNPSASNMLNATQITAILWSLGLQHTVNF